MTKITAIKILTLCLVLSACGQKGPLIVDRSADKSLSGQERSTGIDGDTATGLGGINAQVEGSITIIQR